MGMFFFEFKTGSFFGVMVNIDQGQRAEAHIYALMFLFSYQLDLVIL